MNSVKHIPNSLMWNMIPYIAHLFKRQHSRTTVHMGEVLLLELIGVVCARTHKHININININIYIYIYA